MPINELCRSLVYENSRIVYADIHWELRWNRPIFMLTAGFPAYNQEFSWTFTPFLHILEILT